jgi:hypothetical protein
VGRVWHGSIGDLTFQRADRDRVRIADTSISLQLIRATPGKIDYAVFARTSNAVLIVPGNTPAVIHERGFVAAGALISMDPIWSTCSAVLRATAIPRLSNGHSERPA